MKCVQTLRPYTDTLKSNAKNKTLQRNANKIRAAFVKHNKQHNWISSPTINARRSWLIETSNLYWFDLKRNLQFVYNYVQFEATKNLMCWNYEQISCSNFERMLTHQSEYELDNTIFSNLNTIFLKTDLHLKSVVEIKLPLTRYVLHI